MAPLHLEHLGQNGEDTDTAGPAIKEMEGKTWDSSKSVTHKDKYEPPGSPSNAGHAYDSYGLDTIQLKLPLAH